MTQQNRILKLIKEAGSKGIGSNELRNYTKAVDVPKAVSNLRKKGHPIDSRDLKDGTCIYTYKHTQPQWVIVGRDQNGEPLYGWQTPRLDIPVIARPKREVWGVDNMGNRKLLTI